MNISSDNQISRAFKEYIKEGKYSKSLRPATLKGYSDAFKNFCNLMPEITTPSDLKPEVFTVFFERLNIRFQVNNKEIRDSTKYSYYVRLIMFVRWLENKEYISEVSEKMVSPPIPQYNDYRALTDNEIAKLFTCIILRNKDNPFLQVRDLMMLNILIYTGVRKNELLNLKVNDIDLSGKSIMVNGNTSKSKRTRRIPLHPNVLYAIDNYLNLRKKSSCEYLIITQDMSKRLSEHGLVYWANRYKRLSKTHFFLHRCRHTFACKLARKGADITTIKNLMGHSSILMTERYLRSIGLKDANVYIQKMS